jgi:hypothetical protein
MHNPFLFVLLLLSTVPGGSPPGNHHPNLYNEALGRGKTYPWLDYLSNRSAAG